MTFLRSIILSILFLYPALCAAAIEEVEGDYESVQLHSYFVPDHKESFTIRGKVYIAVFDAFKEKYPYIELTGDPLPLMIRGLGTEARLLMSIAGGTASDVILCTFRQSGTYIGQGFFLELDQFINDQITADEARARGIFDANIMYRDELEQRVRPQVMDALHTQGRDGTKHYYMMPRKYDVRVMAYNKVLFRKMGLNPIEDVPKTWDEFWEIGKKLTDPEQGLIGFLARDLSGTGGDQYLSWVSYPFFLSTGARAVKRDSATSEWYASFNDRGSIEAADFYLKLLQAPWEKPETGKTYYGVAESLYPWQKWYKGELGMVFLSANDILMNENSWISTKTYDEVGIAAIPKAPNGQSTTELGPEMLGILATIDDPAVIDAAWRFIRFMGSEESRRIEVDVYVRNGYAKFIMPELLIKYGYEAYVEDVPRDWAEAVKYSFEHSYPEPYGKNTQHIYPMMSAPLIQAMNEDLGKNPDREYRLSRLQELFDQAVKETDERMLDKIPPEKLIQRRVVALIIATLIFAIFIALFIFIWRTFTPANLPLPANQTVFRKFRVAYLLLVPAALTILVFNYYPLVRGGVLAFTEYSVVTGSRFVGLDNFAKIFYDSQLWLSILRGGYYAVLFILMVFFPPILLAIMLSEIPRGKVFLRVVFYLPAVISGIVMMLLWRKFFLPTPDGEFNQIVGMLGLGPFRWLDEKSTAMFSVMIPQAWAGLGPGCLIYLAALKTVPDDLYEAVAIDGGGFFKRIKLVTIPMIKPLILINLIFAFIGAFQAADAVLVMTGGGPDYATHVIGLEIFFNTFMFQRFGVATSMAWILGFILIGFTVFQMKRLSKMTFTTAG